MVTPGAAQAHEVRIGVLAKRGAVQARAQWSPVADYLSRSIPGEHFVIVPLGFSAIQSAVTLGRIDFVLANSYIYVNLETRGLVTAIATMKNLRLGGAYTRFGGVIFTRADRTDLRELGDLRGTTFMAVDERSLGGYLMARLAFRRSGLDLARDMKDLRFGGTHDAVVYAVRDGIVDAGTVRTDTLERMQKEGLIDLHKFRILHRQESADDTGFPFAHSTRLYPEWPLAETWRTPEQLADRVALALLDMPSDHPAARAARIAGWNVPLNYQPVHELLRVLRVEPYAKPVVRLTFLDVLREQQNWVVGTFVALLLLSISTIHALRMNQNLRRVRVRLVQEVRASRRAEAALAAQRDRLELDIRERTRELEHLRLYDPLTSLPNRILLYDRVDRLIAACSRGRCTLTVILIGIDNFKEVNNTFGHYHGDLLLEQIAQRLRNTPGMAETLSRFGGYQFAVALKLADATHDLVEVIDNLQRAFERPFILDGAPIQVTISSGAAHYPQHGMDADTLLRHAEVAMYTARREHSGFAVYEPEQDRFSKQRLSVASELTQAITKDQLVLLYQPKVSIATGQLVGLEALVRWHHPELGMLAPDKFVPLAEQTGLIRPLTLWVLNAALRQCNEWYEADMQTSVAVNLSTWNLHDTKLVAQVRELLAAWDVGSDSLELEVTETAMMLDRQRAREALTAFHESGIRISIDDFGTGYSSLSYLQQLPVDVLKIDRSFVQDLPDNPANIAITRSIVHLAHSLSLKVVAEGVETEQALAYLRGIGCDVAQGYYFDRPLPTVDITHKWLTCCTAPLRLDA